MLVYIAFSGVGNNPPGGAGPSRGLFATGDGSELRCCGDTLATPPAPPGLVLAPPPPPLDPIGLNLPPSVLPGGPISPPPRPPMTDVEAGAFLREPMPGAPGVGFENLLGGPIGPRFRGALEVEERRSSASNGGTTCSVSDRCSGPSHSEEVNFSTS